MIKVETIIVQCQAAGFHTFSLLRSRGELTASGLRCANYGLLSAADQKTHSYSRDLRYCGSSGTSHWPLIEASTRQRWYESVLRIAEQVTDPVLYRTGTTKDHMDIEQEMERLKGIEEEHNKLIHSHPTLRDQMAMAALTGLSVKHETLLASNDLIAELGTIGIDKLQANKAYRLADAMLKERTKNPMRIP